MSSSPSREIIVSLIRICIACAGTYFSVKLMLKALDPNKDQKEKSAKKAEELLKIIDLPTDIEIDDYEMRIAAMLVPPANGIDFKEIGGLDAVIKEISQRVILPLRLLNEQRSLPASSLLTPAKGLLLYGHPGCGKTMIARAVAKSIHARFIELDVSVLTDKWYGESHKLVAALFSFAKKVEPCIIFIDEIDGLLRDRFDSDNETTAMIKSQFMSLWDGFASSNNKVIIMGATNTPNSVDPAIFRRLPFRIEVPKPNSKARIEILKIVLKNEKCDKLDFEQLANLTETMAASDLKEICRTAALHALAKAYDADNHLISPNLTLTQNDLIVSIYEYFNNSFPRSVVITPEIQKAIGEDIKKFDQKMKEIIEKETQDLE